MALLTAASAGSLILSNAIPAGASAGPGVGAFIGFETAPDSALILPSALCAEFDPGGAFGPLVENLTLAGTFNGSTAPLTGSATFTSTSAKYDANPVGTFADGSNCVGTPFTVPGTLSINMGTVTCTSTTGSAGYLRTASSVVVITGGCGGVSLTLTVGLEEPCIAVLDPCPVLGSDALLQGAYVQT
jgi:hypothetical protein